MHPKERSAIIAFAAVREANTKEIMNLNASKISKKVLDNRSGLMYDIRVASEKNLTKLLIRSKAEHLPGRVPKYQKNQIYDNLTEMQP